VMSACKFMRHGDALSPARIERLRSRAAQRRKERAPRLS
jgi:hypothetical protein